jgi:photosystem II stability/assembly factor-like uncharacterized protein
MRTRVTLTFTALLALVTASGGVARAATVDEIVARHVKARGGADRLKAIRSLRLTGTVTLGGGNFRLEAGWGQLIRRPGLIRTELTLQGVSAVNAFDGRQGWSVQPFGGRLDPERSSEDDARPLAQTADIDGPLVEWLQKGHRIEYLGTEDVDGTKAHKLRARLKDGDLQYLFLDPDAYLVIRVVTHGHVRGTENITETEYGGYHQVAGVWIPFFIESGPKGQPKNFRIAVERAEVNVDAPDALFRIPTGATAPKRVIVAATNAPRAEVTAPPAVSQGEAPAADAGVISGLGIRNIGSAAMSGRIAAVAARNQGGKTILFVGAASGGVWRSLDGGTTFQPVFDKQPVQSIGAITIDPSNPRTVWVGTGEPWTRNSVSIGNGVYKSVDGGDTWRHMGLPASERITRILVHPKNGNIVYVCAPGRLWSDSRERGLYRTTDGGKSWKLILRGTNLSTGCSSVTMDPGNSNVLFAGMWDFRRKGWTFRSGGDGPTAPSGSGLFRSTDGGNTWSPLTASTRKGLPRGPWGRVEVIVAPSSSRIVYAFIESKSSALYRSDDGGATWKGLDRSQQMVWRPFYFARLVVDPKNPNRLYKTDLDLIVSTDGGRSFSSSGGGAHGDWHDLWIDPDNTNHVIGGDDGGLWTSWDGGNRWWKSENLPISQFYHVSVDDKDPYRVYGGLQDNGSWTAESQYPGGISNARWDLIFYNDGFWAMADPSDPDAAYAEGQGGYIVRVDRRTRLVRDIQPKAGYKEKLRFNWNTPIHVSPTRKSTLYLGSQFLFRSRDRGDSWERISPDLTTNDPAKQKQELSGGITVDNSSAEMHTTIFSISESPRNANIIWVGTDDGNVQVTRNGGKSWTNVVGNIKGLPPASWVSWVEASRFDAATAYAAFDRHTFGDMTAWVYKTTDFGKTWTRIVGPDKGVRGYAHVVKEDIVERSLLFVGTELGLWISIDGGAKWAEFKGGDFPAVAVRDLAIQRREGDLVLGTHGRGIWIIDDLSPLRALSAELLAKPAAFLPSRPLQQRMPAMFTLNLGDNNYVGANPPGGVTISYYLRSRHLYGPIKLEILDDKGKVIDIVPAGKRRGVNRVSWSMQLRPPRVPRAAQVAFNASQGPRVLPGTYTARLTRGSEVVEAKMKIGLDPRAPYTLADRRQQLKAAMSAHALFGDMTTLLDRIDGARLASGERAGRVPKGDALAGKLRGVAGRLEELRKKIVATTEGGAITGEERIREHLDTVYGSLTGWEGRPARYQVERVEVLRRELGDVEKEFAEVVTKELKPLEGDLKRLKLAPIPTDARAEVEVPRSSSGRLAGRALECLVRNTQSACAAFSGEAREEHERD